MSKRAIRRHHRDRIIAKTRRLLRYQGWDQLHDPNTDKVVSLDWFNWVVLHKRHRNFTSCSCVLCGNPRRHYSGSYKLSRQEQKASLDPDFDAYLKRYSQGCEELSS